ncbi:PAS domain-containing sensor histidine kinase [Candidatus Thorarchaeota archaeon]|nr:MAG: PAS domain-containing sensor histidine kinase [Candidatus Thorarchaeota archaeon]
MTDEIQKDSHQPLSQEEQALRYRALIDSMNDGLGIIDNEGVFTYVNTRFADILGYGPSNIVGKQIYDFLDEKNRKTLRDNIRRRTEGQSTQYELEWTKKSGEQVPTIISGTPLVGEDGNIQGSFAVVTDITEIKQSRIALEESAEMMRTIFEQSQIGFELFDKDGILITANKAALEIGGVSDVQELIGFSLFDDPNVPNDIKAKLIRGEAVEYETEFDFEKVKETSLYNTSRSGKMILDAFITPLGNRNGANGEITGYLSQIIEKTEHRRVEEALEDTEKRYQLLAENVSDVIFTSDLELNLTYLSTSIEVLLGYSSDELIGVSLIELMAPESVWIAIEAIREALDTDKLPEKPYIRGDAPPLELHLKRKDGSLVWVEVTRIFMRDENEVPIGVLGVARNIEERRLAQKTLVNSELKYRTLVDQSFQGIMIIQALPLTILFSNPAFAGFLNRSVEEVLAFGPVEIQSMIHPEDLDTVMNRLQELMSGNEPKNVPMAIRVFQKDGEMQWLEMFGRKVEFEGKSALQLVAMNVTDRINADKRIRTQKERAMLYLDLMSHDFRNQLQIILGSTMVMETRLEDSDDRRLLAQVVSAVERCQRMISKAKVTEPLMSIPLRPTKLAPILERVVMLQMEMNEDVDIAITMKDADAIIDADKFLEQLFSNLIENSIEHNPRTERQVWVQLRKKGDGYEVSVADNGSGISESLKKEIFDISRRYGGIGLHQSKQICEKYGGHISVRDRIPEKPDQGVEFIVWVPRNRAANSS